MPTYERQTMRAKVEGTYGVDPTTAATDAYLVSEVAYKVSPSVYRSPQQAATQAPRFAPQAGKFQPDLSFKQGLRGNTSALDATHPPLCHAFLQASGWIGVWAAGPATWTYTYTPGSATSIWVEWNLDGMLHTLRGARGGWTTELTPGELVDLSWAFQGLWTRPTAASVPTSTPANPSILRCEGVSFAPFSDSISAGEFGRISKVGIDTRPEMFRHPDVNAPDGVAEVHVLGHGTAEDRGVLLTLEGTRPGDSDSARWLDRFLDGEISAACSITLGSSTLGSKQTCAINFGRLVVTGMPEDTKMGSVIGWKAPCLVMGSAAGTTEDDMTIVWTQHA